MPDDVLHDMAANLMLISEFLNDANRLSEAITTSTAVVEIYGMLNSGDPFLKFAYAWGLGRRASGYREAGLIEDAQRDYQSAIDVHVALQGQSEDEKITKGSLVDRLLNAELSYMLYCLSSTLFRTANLDDAATTVTRAITLQRRLCEHDTASTPILAPLTWSLNLHSLILRDQGRFEEGIIPGEEDAQLTRRMITASASPPVSELRSSIVMQLRSLSRSPVRCP